MMQPALRPLFLGLFCVYWLGSIGFDLWSGNVHFSFAAIKTFWADLHIIDWDGLDHHRVGAYKQLYFVLLLSFLTPPLIISTVYSIYRNRHSSVDSEVENLRMQYEQRVSDREDR